MALLRLEKIGKRYRQGEVEVQALQDVDLAVEEGEFAALVGPSGSGKTTLLNIIGGLDAPSAGKVHLNSTELTDLDEAALSDFRLFQLGFIFQAYNLVPVLSALENVELIMVLQGREAGERRQRAEYYLELVGLKGLMHRRPAALSGGQQQRVAVARALANDPILVLADEPSGNLDHLHAEQLHDLLAVLAREFETALVVVTHNRQLAARADRVLTVEDGRLVPTAGLEVAG